MKAKFLQDEKYGKPLEKINEIKAPGKIAIHDKFISNEIRENLISDFRDRKSKLYSKRS